MTGQAGVNLVLSCLLGWGVATHPAMEGLPYDLIVDVPDLDLLRIQVKTMSYPRNDLWSFTMKRGFYRSRKGMFAYGKGDFDIAAFVCLSLKKLFFVAAPISRISVPTGAVLHKDSETATFHRAIQTIQKRRLADNLAWLASMTPAPTPPAPAAASIQPVPGRTRLSAQSLLLVH
ncbi:hypothetical protein Aam_096_013 [Acidocella aminolytica 101 = DSM 11237]|uniref:PD(D/E)XK endonuclease domain-containing protein n=2 Tax=Acidocella TaxID=50709 RepID=A0A0D6PL16_9PROT|nr:group I intron-associated PD-(D/E)XK endonuclease [Acidocella aminolytica]GAN81454.1 hypothetical protein Aam_096_013 [Acidocella aminolytica 101 = DSM 11237]